MAAAPSCWAVAGWQRSPELTRELRVPVIDGVSAAVKMVESLVALGLSTSKHGDLAFPENKPLSGHFQALNPF